MPIGGVIGYRDFVSPSGVGYDIGCGNKAVRTNLRYTHMEQDTGKVMDEIVRRISFGVGRRNDEPVDHPVIDQIAEAAFHPQRTLVDLARKQLGTVGAGNHYVDLFCGDDGYVWVGVHFGSRGFGHKTATGFLAMAQGEGFHGKAKDTDMFGPPVLFHTATMLGQAYVSAMQLAGAYAYAGRDVVVDKVLEILGCKATFEVHNHHNYTWLEKHHGEWVWVVRKGATPAAPGQYGFVGSSMGETSVILRGSDNPNGDAEDLLLSTVHGAGRAMSRSKAAGKKRKRTTCKNRDCDWVQEPHTPRPDACPSCGSPKLGKVWVQETEGAIDWESTLHALSLKDIELRGGAADEAPGAYKRLNQVLGFHKGTVDVMYHLNPIGVAMAGANTFDPYKD